MGRLRGRAGELRVTIHSLATCQGRVWVVGSEPAPSSLDSPDLAADEDRESFQATLRLGTLGGRIRPVKR